MCLDDQILNTYLDGELAEPWKTQVEEHLSYCPACKARYEQLKKLHEVIAGAVLTDERSPRIRRRCSLLSNITISTRSERSVFSIVSYELESRRSSPPPRSVRRRVHRAFVLFGTSGDQTAEIIPGMSMNVDSANIMQVRASDNIAASRTLDSYSLEEILK
jgi:anti-sigma factor RsiW